jgi:hypothetical protein
MLKQSRQILKDLSCRTGPLRVGRSLRDMYTPFGVVLPLVGTEYQGDQRERHAKRYTPHEVGAARVGRPSGRT